jgi:hypothetical protein
MYVTKYFNVVRKTVLCTMYTFYISTLSPLYTNKYKYHTRFVELKGRYYIFLLNVGF